MAYEHKPGTGTLFINTKTSDTQPDLKGEINIDGKVHKIAFWKKQTKSGMEMYSGKVDDRPVQPKADMSPSIETNDLPF